MKGLSEEKKELVRRFGLSAVSSIQAIEIQWQTKPQVTLSLWSFITSVLNPELNSGPYDPPKIKYTPKEFDQKFGGVKRQIKRVHVCPTIFLGVKCLSWCGTLVNVCHDIWSYLLVLLGS